MHWAPDRNNMLSNEKGMALLLTILIIGLMSIITSEFIQARWQDRHATANLSDGIRLNAMARSGFQFALGLVLEEGKLNVFYRHHEIRQITRELTEYSGELFNHGHFEVNIQDQSGRIQINRLVRSDDQYDEIQRELLTTLLSLDEFGLTLEEIDDMVDSIKDWIDRDDEVTQFGAENAFYQSLERPYFCRNAPLETLDELMLINHITPRIYHGTAETPGLKSLLTVYGQDGKININTADPLLLRALSLVILGQDLSEDWIQYRDHEGSDLSDYRNYQGLSDLSGEQRLRAGALLTTSCNFFQITSIGVLEGMRKGISAFIKRDSPVGDYEILSWEVF